MWLKDYSGAISIFNQLEGKCHLEDEYLNIHEIANRNGKESIFESEFDEKRRIKRGKYSLNMLFL
ncbi:hypothetical protein EZS27_022510 [termite gut metagenome]|uniref:Uncharacterized protein n=1 Tax=termite gut metagenome TaxID=433724 RepID=A0A5J4R4G3_9ZZZZ